MADTDPLNDLEVLELMILRVFMKDGREDRKHRWLVELDESTEPEIFTKIDAAQVAREVIAEVVKHKAEVESEAHPATRSLA